jgi:FAD/FMN-containing dehydrogenase
VIRPRHREDVVACAQYASENKIPLHARGAGTGLAGESLGPGLVLDFSVYMRRILATEGDEVRVLAPSKTSAASESGSAGPKS